MCGMTHSYVWHDSSTCVTMQLRAWCCVKGRMHMCYITHSDPWHVSCNMCDMTDSCVPWLIYMSDMIYSHASHSSFERVASLVYMRDMTQSYAWCDLWLIDMCDMPDSFVWHDIIYICYISLMCDTCFIHTCDVDSFVCDRMDYTGDPWWLCVAVCCRCVAVCCSVLQCVAGVLRVCCRCVAGVLQVCVAGVLQVCCRCALFDEKAAHRWMSHFTHVNVTCQTYKYVILHIWIRHVNTCECVMSHVQMRHVTHMKRRYLMKRLCAVCVGCRGIGMPRALNWYVRIYIYTYVFIYVHKYMHVYIYTIYIVFKCTNACMNTYIHTHMNTHIHACIHAWIHRYIDAYTHHKENTWTAEQYLSFSRLDNANYTCGYTWM